MRDQQQDRWDYDYYYSEDEPDEYDDAFGDPRTDVEKASDAFYAAHPEKLLCPFCGIPVMEECEHSVTPANLKKWQQVHD